MTRVERASMLGKAIKSESFTKSKMNTMLDAYKANKLITIAEYNRLKTLNV